jgi:hypothetical protein
MLCIKNNCTLIDMFIFYRGCGTGKKFKLKFIIKKLLQLYNRDVSFYLTKTKASFMASTSKVTFNIDGLTILIQFIKLIIKFIK